MDQNKMIVPGSIILAGVLIAGAIMYTSGPRASAPTVTNPEQNEPVAVAPKAEPTIGNNVVLGDPKAPVTLIQWGDYECPFCEQFYTQVEKKVRDEYVASGKVKIVFRDFPLSFHPAAAPAANAAACAQEQGKFWAYHDALYDRQATIGTLDYVKLAGTLGLNASSFKSCFDRKKYQADIDKDQADGTAAGVDGTPTSFVNNTIIAGAQPYASVKAAIDAELAKVR